MPGRSAFRTLARLVIGGVLNGLEGINNRLAEWEPEPDPPPAPTVPALPAHIEPYAAVEIPVQVLPAQESPADWATYALVGLLIKSQERVETYVETTDRATRVIGRWGDLLYGPLYRSRWMSPVRGRLERLADRGHQVIDDWVATGRAETTLGRRLARAAVTERVDNAIDYLTANEEVQELVQSQSASLVDEVIEETRERTVSADNFLEAVVRSMFHRPPRWELPEPPPHLKAKADEHIRPAHGHPIEK